MSAGIEFEHGLPVKIESFASADERRRYELVRTDNFRPIVGEILSANVAAREATISVKIPGADERKTETVNCDFKIIVRRRA